MRNRLFFKEISFFTMICNCIQIATVLQFFSLSPSRSSSRRKMEKREAKVRSDLVVGKPSAQSQVKMPKFKISKWDASYAKWLSFLNKFTAEIDKMEISLGTNFAYLKELLCSDVLEEVDGLPFTTEGYQRLKNILETNHSNISEIVRSYIDNI